MARVNVSKGLSLVILAAIVASAGIAASQGTQRRPGMDAKGMDANGDGKISKQEFTRFHQGLFDRMKGKDGTIAARDMQDMHADCPMMQGADKAREGAGMRDHLPGMAGGAAKK